MVALLAFTTSMVWGCTHPHHLPMKQAYELKKPTCDRVITADVVALDQVYYYNRFGSFNPAGIMYALRRDVVIDRESLDEIITGLRKEIKLLEKLNRPVPDSQRVDLQRLEQLYEKFSADPHSKSKQSVVRKVDSNDNSKKEKPELINGDLDAEKESEINIPSKEEGLDRYLAGHIKLRSDKRPRPLVLRANEKDCLQVTFTNLLALSAGGQEVMNDPEFRLTHPEKVVDEGGEDKKVIKPIKDVIDGEEPATRHASMHVNGLALVDSIESQGVNVGQNGWRGQDGKCSANLADFGKNLCVLAAPGETRTYTWHAKKEGTYLFYSMGAPAGGEGDGGQLGLGLFGAINVEPTNATWYRSQVTEQELTVVSTEERTQVQNKPKPYDQPIISYEKQWEDRTRRDSPRQKSAPVDTCRTTPKIADKKGTLQQRSECVPILNMLRETRPEEKKDATGSNAEPVCVNGHLSYREDPLTHKLQPICIVPGIYEIVHSDLNAVIDIQHEEDCDQQGEGNACGKPYREFTTIFHDEVTAVQAFTELDEENSPLSSLRDGMGINYGASGLGAMVIANRKKTGPSRDCVECKLEEFFLTSWVHGDPAMVVGYKKDEHDQLVPIKNKGGEQARDAEGRPLYQKEAKYPDDPSNVHHSYLGDPVRFRNMHAGPKETHVFHLHAHQWVEDKHDPLSHYLDSQTISPGATFSYEVHYGGSGNRNFGPGDSIFHCHLYPHFAQGMWELWRTHDVFEDGTPGGVFDPKKPIGKDNNPRWRNLPDAEIAEGTPNPAIVPLPRTPLPPMPNEKFEGYPFYIAGEKGHRPPQAPGDLDPEDHAQLGASTLRRHIIVDGVSVDGTKADEPKHIVEDVRKSSKNGADPIPPRQTKHGKSVLYEDGKNLSDYTARRVFRDNQNNDFFGLARQLTSANIEVRSEAGTGPEQVAMQFHAGTLTHAKHGPAIKPGQPGWTHTQYNWEAAGYPTCLSDGTCDNEEGARVLFRVNGGGNTEKEKRGKGEPGAPFANPCPNQFVDEKGHVRPVMTREYRTAYIQMDMTVNKAGWHDPQARLPVLEEDLRATLDGTRPTEPLFFRANSGECVVFKATNLIPSNLNLDDFQVYSPTDTMGQHIHLVKFDVTASDGSGNGWNYEDGTLAADEVRERIVAHNRYEIEQVKPGKAPQLFEPKTHRLFMAGGAMAGDPRGVCSESPLTQQPGESPMHWIERWDKWGKDASQNHPWCGAQTTIQRWWADPVLNGKPGEKGVKDRTLRTVFTHDHFGPSSHQHHGFYAALVIEPRNSKWFSLDGQDMGGTDEKGTPFRVKGRQDGGPTSYAANIIARDEGKACLNMKTVECSHQLDNKDSIDRHRTGREFNLAFADFAIVYTSDRKEDEPMEGNRLRPVNPPNHAEGGVHTPVIPGRLPTPEGISTKDPGTQLINYRNEPIPLRIGERHEVDSSKEVPSPWSCLPLANGKKSCFEQKPDEKGDMAHVFSSETHSYQGRLGIWGGPQMKDTSIFTERLGDTAKLIGRQPGDPATPLLQAYDGDRVQIRLIQGAQEEQHVFTMHGARWLTQPDSPDSGYVNAQHIGISEHFEFNDRIFGLSALPPGELGQGVRMISCEESNKEKPCRTDLMFASSAIDNLWDGQWGLMRIYPAEENLSRILARLPGSTDKNPFAAAFSTPELDELLASDPVERPKLETEEPKKVQDPVEAFCADPARKDFLKTFSIEAWMAKDLLGKQGEKGLVYNEKFGITDPDAILFVEQGQMPAIRNGKSPEPLILRARAGDCIEVTVTNHLPKTMPDDPSFPNWQNTWSYNMLPPIIEGFNFNQLRSSNRVGLHAGLVDQNIRRHDGAHIGFNEDSTVEPEDKSAKTSGIYIKSKTYRWYAGDLKVRKEKLVGRPIEFGVIPLTDQADVIKHPAHGAIGALVIEPQCSETEVDSKSNAAATVTWWNPEPETDRYGMPKKSMRCPKKPKEGMSKAIDTALTPSYWFSEERFNGLRRFKEFVLLYQDALALQQYGQPMPNLRNGDDAEDSGQKAFNYRTEPLWARLGASAADEPEIMSEYDWSNVLSSTVSHEGCSTPPCDPKTPIFSATAGELVRFRVAHPGGHPRMHALAIFGHDWQLNPWENHSRTMRYNPDSPTRFGATNGIGPARHLNIVTRAGGDCAVPGDYLYRTQEGFMFGGGLWGIFRVNPAGDSNLKQDPDACKIDVSKTDTAPH